MAFKIGDKVVMYRNNEARTGISNRLIGKTLTIVGDYEGWWEVEENYTFWYIPPSYLKYAR